MKYAQDLPLWDLRNVARYAGARLVPGVCVKEHGALFGEDFYAEPPKPWEVRIDNGYPNVFFDDEAGLYRCYYTAFIEDEASEAFPLPARGGRHYAPKRGRITGLLYAESKDGLRWEKPALGLVDFHGSKDNNILIRRAHGASVFKDAREKDPVRRYKALFRYDEAEQMAVAFSADGVHFGEPICWAGESPAGDTHNFAFYDEIKQKYVCVTRTWDWLRVAALCESADFIHWTSPVEIARGEGFDDQVYSMPVFRHMGLYTALPSMLHGGDRAGAHYDRVDCELSVSADLAHFTRIAPGTPLIPRGTGADAGCVYASAPIADGDDLIIYYMGGTGPHTDFRQTSLLRCRFDARMLAVWQAEGRGYLMTRPLAFTGENLCIACEGAVRAMLCDRPKSLYEKEAPLPGYGFDDCRITREGRLTRLAFPNLAHAPRGARLFIEMDRARIGWVGGDFSLSD